MISKSVAIEVLNEALATGADYAEIFYEDSNSNAIRIENNKVEASTSNSMNGVGIRLLKENQTIYGYTNELTKNGLLKLAKSLASSFNGKRIITVTNLEMIKSKNRNPVKNSYNDISKEEKIALVKEGTQAIADLKDPRIVRYFGSFLNNHRFVAVFNSKGKWFKRDSEFGRLSYQVIAANEKGMESLGNLESLG